MLTRYWYYSFLVHQHNSPFLIPFKIRTYPKQQYQQLNRICLKKKAFYQETTMYFIASAKFSHICYKHALRLPICHFIFLLVLIIIRKNYTKCPCGWQKETTTSPYEDFLNMAGPWCFEILHQRSFYLTVIFLAVNPIRMPLSSCDGFFVVSIFITKTLSCEKEPWCKISKPQRSTMSKNLHTNLQWYFLSTRSFVYILSCY